MLCGKKIVLRPISIDDFKDTLELRHDFEANRALQGYPFPVNEISEKRWIENLYGERESKRIDFAIIQKKTNSFVGLISAKQFHLIHRRVEFGIIIKRKFWRKGYGEDAAIIFLHYLFEEINIERVYLEVLFDNHAAIKLYEKIGFKKEGILRKHSFQKGQRKDVTVMGLLRDEFYKSHNK